jgi:glycine C-acetyltransferase
MVAWWQIKRYGLSENAATYIYSNSLLGHCRHAAVELVDSAEGKDLLAKLAKNVLDLKTAFQAMGILFAANSIHPIQPMLIGETQKTKDLTTALYNQGFLVTNINYPVVSRGRDEIRVQLSASHTANDLEKFLTAVEMTAQKLAII